MTPTTYRNINFRSRLMATWAAFFDLCEWDWEYEPMDTEFGDCPPDFKLTFSYNDHEGDDVQHVVWAVVRPVDWSEDGKVAHTIKHHAKLADLRGHFTQVSEGAGQAATSTDAIVILGRGPKMQSDGCALLGVRIDYAYDDGNLYNFILYSRAGESRAEFPHHWRACMEDHFDIIEWGDRINDYLPRAADVEWLWAQARNLTQHGRPEIDLVELFMEARRLAVHDAIRRAEDVGFDRGMVRWTPELINEYRAARDRRNDTA